MEARRRRKSPEVEVLGSVRETTPDLVDARRCADEKWESEGGTLCDEYMCGGVSNMLDGKYADLARISACRFVMCKMQKPVLLFYIPLPWNWQRERELA